MSVDIVILNHNGRALLEACLPSVVRAAAASRHPCAVVVIDNDSSDDSRRFLADRYPSIRVYHQPNRGLCSYNYIVPRLSSRVVLLLNNDVKLAPDAIDPLVEPLLNNETDAGRKVWMTAPRAWLFDQQTHEGFLTAVSWRWGLIQATAHFPGCSKVAAQSTTTASAGAALAVDRATFTALGGFDPLYLPGRLEDVDLAYRAYQRGLVARYVSASHCLHRGQATFDAQYGSAATLQLALRNTLLFQWKNLRHPWHVLRQLIELPVRLVAEVIRAPFQTPDQRGLFLRALVEACGRLPAALNSRWREPTHLSLERAYFAEFAPARLASLSHSVVAARAVWQLDERQRGARHPLSRHYVLPAVWRLADSLAATRIRPWHWTTVGLCCTLLAITALIFMPASTPVAALLVWLAWLCDRVDGPLARRQQSASTLGAWLDANIDEFSDLALHVATAWAAAAQGHTFIAWSALLAFVFGKYLFIYGLANTPNSSSDERDSTTAPPQGLRALYHLPGNADVRVHLLLAALLSGQWVIELVFIAAYYNVRWLVRFARTARRLLALQRTEVAT